MGAQLNHCKIHHKGMFTVDKDFSDYLDTLLPVVTTSDKLGDPSWKIIFILFP